MIPVSKVAMSPDALGRVAEVLDSGRLEHGPRAARFECEVGRRIGNPKVVAVNCATSGIHLALNLARGAEPGAEVLSTPLTFEGTNWPILANGMRLRWVDVDPATLCIDLDDLERKITPATRAVVVVHWTGYPVDLDRLRGILDRAEADHGVRPLAVEDAAQAWGARYKGGHLGGHGNMCVFSFGAIKTLTCGSGGLVALPTEELRRRAQLTRWLGIDRDADRARGDYEISEWGFRYPMNEMSAAVGLANLDLAEEMLARHRENAAHFDKELSGLPGLELTERCADREPSFWVYPVKVDDREGFVRRMAAAGIATSRIARRNDEHPCVRDLRADLPGLESVYDRAVCIPVGWWLSPEDRGHVIETIKSGW